jgi:hypothetical protein
MIDTSTSQLDRLRAVLRANVVFTTAAAVVLIAMPGRLDALLGTRQETLIRLAGVGLGVFAGAVASISRAQRAGLISGATVVAAADVSWVAASVVAVSVGWFDPAGVVAVAVCALIVGGFAAVELTAARHASLRSAGVER